MKSFIRRAVGAHTVRAHTVRTHTVRTRSLGSRIVSARVRTALAQTLAVCVLSAGFTAALETVHFTAPAFALTQQEVSDRLATVPAFVVGVGEDLILYQGQSADGEAAGNDKVYVFWSRQAAEEHIAAIRSQGNAQNLPAEAGVVVRRLSYLYALEESSQTEGDRPLDLVFIPELEKAQDAIALNSDFNRGVPLFYPQLENGAPISINQNDGEAIFPMFFSKDDLETLLSDLNERDSEAREVLSVGVVSLETVLTQMVNSEDDLLNQVRLLPDSVVINELQQNQ